MDIHEIRQVNSALKQTKRILEDALVTITAEDVESLTEEDESECSEIFPCGELGEGDEINQFISDVIEQFVEQGLTESDAQELVFSSLAEFIDAGELGDTPDVDASLEQKREWILGFDKLLEQRLSDDNN